jgi:hypothetical protein
MTAAAQKTICMQRQLKPQGSTAIVLNPDALCVRFGSRRQAQQHDESHECGASAMIPAFVVGVLIGAIAGWAVSAWRAARDDAPAPSVGISAIGLTNGQRGLWMDPFHARLLKPILERMDKEL